MKPRTSQARHLRHTRTSAVAPSEREKMLMEMRLFTAQMSQDPELAKEMLIAAGIAVEQCDGELSLSSNFAL